MAAPAVSRPLAELHRHLDGSLREATARTLAADLGVAVPEPLGFVVGMGLQAALARFAFSTALLQTSTALRRVAAEACDDAAAEGVTTLELRFAPQLHGADLGRNIDAVLDGIGGRAGLILCGLYGEAPELLERLVDLAAARPGVVGLDVAGGPLPTHAHRLVDYAAAFRRAAGLGLGRTVHAGEGRPAAEIRTAIEVLGAARIGHGCSILDDDEAVDLALARGIVFEACPTSNVHTGVFADVGDHPLRRWLARGLRVAVCADNTLFSATDVAEELRRLRAAGVLDAATEAKVIADGHAAAFRR